MSARELLGNWNIRRDSDSLRRLLFDGGENAGRQKSEKKPSDLAWRWWESHGDRSIKDTVRIGTAYMPRRQRVEDRTLG